MNEHIGSSAHANRRRTSYAILGLATSGQEANSEGAGGAGGVSLGVSLGVLSVLCIKLPIPSLGAVLFPRGSVAQRQAPGQNKEPAGPAFFVFAQKSVCSFSPSAVSPSSHTCHLPAFFLLKRIVRPLRALSCTANSCLHLPRSTTLAEEYFLVDKPRIDKLFLFLARARQAGPDVHHGPQSRRLFRHERLCQLRPRFSFSRLHPFP